MKPWYEVSFGNDYLLVYKHRDAARARHEAESMIRWLHLPPGAAILDLCCGTGRHSLALADLGYRVTGIDLSEQLLERARKHDSDGKVEWLRGDMRCVPVNGPFDAVVNLFTSFGYFAEDSENAKVIREIDRVLKPDGKFIIDFLNAAYVRAHLVPYSEREVDGLRIEEHRSIEDDFVRKRVVIKQNGRADRTFTERVKLYGLEQFETMMRGTALKIDRVYGDYDGQRYVPERSPRLIMVGRKEGRPET